jgi:hypothetical protein
MLYPKYVWMLIGWYSEKWYLEGDDEEALYFIFYFS